MSGASPKSRGISAADSGTKGRIHTYLLLFPQSKETHTGHLHHLESNTRNITLGLTTATETGDEDFVVLIDKVETTVVLRAQNFPNVSPL
jgi:hypothetical protein